MNPLEFIKFIADRLIGTQLEPWVNIFLFLVFVSACIAAINLLLGSKIRQWLFQPLLQLFNKLNSSMSYAPEWGAFISKVDPYVDFTCSIFFALMGLYSATVVGIALFLSTGNMSKISLWAVFLAFIWIIASFLYMRLNLVSASWAYHKIKNRQIQI